MTKTKSGFTIVELLIVIVIIAILAAITITAFTGVQQRANNTKTIAAVQQAIKLTQIYKSNTDAYPSGGYAYACLGEYDSDICQFSSPGVAEASEQTSFKTAIATVGTMPQPAANVYTLDGTRTGAGGYYRTTPFIGFSYYLSGINQPCVIAGATATNRGDATGCSVTLP